MAAGAALVGVSSCSPMLCVHGDCIKITERSGQGCGYRRVHDDVKAAGGEGSRSMGATPRLLCSGANAHGMVGMVYIIDCSGNGECRRGRCDEPLLLPILDGKVVEPALPEGVVAARR